MTEKFALRLLAIYLTGIFAINAAGAFLAVDSPADGRAQFIGTLFGLLVLTAELVTVYHFVARGSRIARITVTIIGIGNVAATLVRIATVGRQFSVLHLTLVGLSIALIAMIVTLINIRPICALKPPAFVPKPRPAGDSAHEHDWQPHSVMDDWIRCSACGQMHFERGTVAVVNQSP